MSHKPYTFSEFEAFMEILPGLGIKPSLARLKKYVVLSVLQCLEDARELDLRELDLDSALHKFAQSGAAHLSTKTMSDYKSHFKTSIRYFLSWMEDPEKWETRMRERIQLRNRDIDADSEKTAEILPPESIPLPTASPIAYTLDDYEANFDSLPKSSSHQYKRSAEKRLIIRILNGVDDARSVDLREINLDEVFQKFVASNGSNLSPHSLKSYGAIFKGGIRKFLSWKENPVSPEAPPRPKHGPRKSRSVWNSQQINPIAPSEYVVPVRIREDHTVYVANLPYDLTLAEVRRMKRIIAAHAVDASSEDGMEEFKTRELPFEESCSFSDFEPRPTV